METYFLQKNKSEQSELCSDVVEGDGFEPSKQDATDLQSAPFGHSGTPPQYIGAGDGTRTRNLLITNQLLCQLSYTSLNFQAANRLADDILPQYILFVNTFFLLK